MSLPTFATFFAEYQDFNARRDVQRTAGVNDYSLLASLLGVNDEVRLHSRFLYSLLNPHGKHNQGSRFARHFCAVLGHADWLDWARLAVRRETGQIDLYLTDGRRHIIVENKLDARDQPAQIERYVAQIRSEHEVDAADVLVVYLSKGRSTPSGASLGGLRVLDGPEGAVLADRHGVPQARYRNCHYGSDVLGWLERCEAEVRAIPNLVHALREYRHVIELATHTYRSRMLTLESFLAEGDAERVHERIQAACEIAARMPAIKAGWLTRLLTEAMDALLAGYPVEPWLGDPVRELQFEARHARAFFGADSGREQRNKGRFWRLVQGPYQDRLLLVCFFGRRMLHIGVMPLPGAGPVALALESEAAAFRRHDAVQAVLPGLVSWAVDLDGAIGALARFDTSDQAGQLRRLLAALFPLSSASTP